MQDEDAAALTAAIAALESQRAALGEAVLELAVTPLRARLAALQRRGPGAGLQRRQVTVLFADVVGSTAMASSVDAEAALDVLSGAMRRMAALVEAHGGRVLRFTGDGVKAAFGMDEAREDDPDRAVRAGLAILQAGRAQADAARLAHGIHAFAVRVGVHTGDVALGAGVDADNTAIGAAVHIAARMEQSAPPGGLRISHDTWSHVRGLFDAEPQPPLSVKGIEAPMSTYLVHAARDRNTASVERGLQGLHTPMVGRDGDLQRLLDVVARAGETRQLQALTLVGDAGLGKSRLLREWLAALSGHHVLAVRAQPDGLLRPWGLLRSLLAVQCGVADTDSAEEARRKVEDGLSPWFDEQGDDQALRQARLIGQLSGLDFGDSPHVRGLDPRSLRDQAFAALRSYLQALAARSSALPLLVVEDLHWADDDSLDLLQHLLAHAADLPLTLVMTARPALLTRRPDWCAAEALLLLQPLAAAQSDALAQALLQRFDGVPAPLAALIVGRAEGNPYYMEELVRRLIDDGVIVQGEPHWTMQHERLQTLQLPGTLVGLLQARLDSLPPGERRAARQASVIGHVFWDDALQAVDADAMQALPALQRMAFVKAHATSDFEGTAQRQFDHHLLHQVTYDTLLKAERRLGHGAVARWLAERTQGRGAEFLAMTGAHAERAGETALAIDCFAQAGLEARKRFANAAAVAWLRHAATLLDQADPARRFELLQQLEQISDATGDRPAQDAVHAEMAQLQARHPDDARQAQLWFLMAMRADRLADTAGSESLARQAFDLAARCGAALWAAKAQAQIAWLHKLRDDPAGASRHIETGLSWAEQVAPEDTRATIACQLRTMAALIAMDQSRYEEAHSMLTAVLSRGEALCSLHLQFGALDNLAVIAAERGQWDEAIGWAERMHTLAQSSGNRVRAATAQYRWALAEKARGDHVVATRLYAQSLATYRATGQPRYAAYALRQLGELHLLDGDASAALQHFEQAQALQQTVAPPLAAVELLANIALCVMRLGQAGAALSTVDALLGRLGGELANRPAFHTITARWICHQVLDAAGDARAAGLLDQLRADVQARASALTDAGDCARLIEAVPEFRDIVAAHRRRGAP